MIKERSSVSDQTELLLTSIKELQQLTRAILDRQDETDAKLEALAMDVHYIKGEVTAMKQDIAELKQDVAVLKQDVAVLKQDVAVLKQDVAVLKQDVAVLKQDVAVLKQDVSDLKLGQQRHERILETLTLRYLELEIHRRDSLNNK
jgi:chromosome segregation ATPase